jgi:hypothetical protein
MDSNTKDELREKEKKIQNSNNLKSNQTHENNENNNISAHYCGTWLRLLTNLD